MTMTCGITGRIYRAEYREWSAVLSIQYDAAFISLSEITNLIQFAGIAIGVGEWRPERNGPFGCFKVDDEGDI